jgi:hypothetical protein
MIRPPVDGVAESEFIHSARSPDPEEGSVGDFRPTSEANLRLAITRYGDSKAKGAALA